MEKRQTSAEGIFAIALIFSIIGYVYYSAFFASPNSNETFTRSSEMFSYTLLKIEKNDQLGFNISVEIPEKTSHNQLESIAEEVRNNSNTTSNKGVIFFFLPDMKLDNGAWAAADYNYNFNIRIIGQSIEDEKIIKSNLNNIRDYYGLWMDNFRSGAVILRIRYDKKLGYVDEFISPTDPKPSKNAIPLKKIIRKSKVTFIDKESDDGNFYEIEKNGDLTSYDNDGFITTFVRLK